MPALTAVELGPDTCVLVRASLHKEEVRVIGVEILDPAAFPGSDAFIAALKQSRSRIKFPRRARVVLISGLAQPLGLNEENTGADVVLAKDSQEQVLLVRSVKRLLNRTVSRKPPRSERRVVERRLARRGAAAL